MRCSIEERRVGAEAQGILTEPADVDRTAKYGPYSQIPPEIPPRGLKTKYDSE